MKTYKVTRFSNGLKMVLSFKAETEEEANKAADKFMEKFKKPEEKKEGEVKA